MNQMNPILEKLERKRLQLHEYVVTKLDDKDYHGVADAAMDLRELEVEIKFVQKLSLIGKLDEKEQ
jgi:hypothetical protein